MKSRNDVSNNEIIAFAALVSALVWLTVKPVTLPCVKCDTGGMFYKCMEGTGAGSFTCRAHRAGEAGLGKLRDGLMTTTEYAKELTLFSTKIPEYLTQLVTLIKNKLLVAASEVHARMTVVWEYVKRKVQEIMTAARRPVYDTWEAFHDAVIAPLIAGMIKYVLEPITQTMDKVVDFAHTVMSQVDEVLEGGGEIVAKAYNAVYEASGTISKSVEKVISHAAEIIEKLVEGVRTSVNSTMNVLAEGLETSVNSIGKGVEEAIGGLEGGVNAVLSSTVRTATDAVNESAKAFDGVVTGTGQAFNSSISKVTKGVEGSINSLGQNVEGAVNTLGSAVIGGIGGVVNETEDIVNGLSDGLTTSVNTIIGVINKDVSKNIETTVNRSADVIEKAVLAGLVPIRSIAKSINKISSLDIKLGALGSIYPFMFIPHVREPAGLTLPTVDIPELDPISIPHVKIPSVSYKNQSSGDKTNSVPLGAQSIGRQRLLEAVERAQKNWTMASGGEHVRNTSDSASKPSSASQKSYVFMPNDKPLAVHHHDSEEDYTWATTLLGETAPSNMDDDPMWDMKTHRTPMGKSFWNKIGDGIKKAANEVSDFAEDTAKKVADEAKELALKTAKPLADTIRKQGEKDRVEASKRAASDVKASEKREAAARSVLAQHKSRQAEMSKKLADVRKEAAISRTERNAKLASRSKDKVVEGVSVPSVAIKVPSLDFKAPGLRVQWKVDPIKTGLPPIRVNIKRPQVNFDIPDISSQVPKIPNLVDGIESAVGMLGEVLKDFLKPVWEALSVLFAYVNTVIASVVHFIREEMNWKRIRDSALLVWRDTARSVREKAKWLLDEVAGPLTKVMLFIRDKIIIMTRVFINMTKGLLRGLKEKIYDLAETLWVKIRPVLRESAVVTGGIGMYALGTVADKLIPLPMDITTKVYTALVITLLALVGAQSTFVVQSITRILRVCMIPVMVADKLFEEFVERSDSAVASFTGRIFGVKT
jgi:hypothetical protein